MTVEIRRTLLLCISVALIFLLSVGDPSSAKRKADDKKKDEEKEWNVEAPEGDWETIVIDTKETTWSDVDVSPDGETLIFDMLGDIYSVPIEGGEARALTSSIAWNIQPRFSPDGTKIAFISDRDGADNLWIMNADGSDPKQVSKEKEHLVHNPAWSPDGEYIAAKKGFTSTRSIPAGEIWLFHVGGGGGLQLTERPHGARDQKTMAEPSFSPDGRYIYYSQDVTGGRVWAYNKDSTGQIFAIKRIDRDTAKTETFVGGAGGAIRPTPSPDGRHLAFVRRTPEFQSAIFLKDLESGKETPLYDKLDRDLQETNGSQGNTTAIAWTPDARSIVFWAAGRFHRVDVETGTRDVIPVHVRTEKKIHRALRFPVEVAPDEFPVKMVRWAQTTPDGERVVFQALGTLWVHNRETGDNRRLTNQSDHFEFYPTLSPDGRNVAYTTWDDEELGSLRVVPVDGGPSRSLTRDAGHYVEPSFSADGRSVVYRKISGGYLLAGSWSMEPGIWTVGLDDREPRRIRPGGATPQFGPKGKRIYFTEPTEETKLALKSVNLQGHEEQTHLIGPKSTQFRLSPDGRWVAFTEQFNAFVAPFTLTGRTAEIGSTSESVPLRQVSKRSGEFLRWTADSRALEWAHGPILYTRELKDAFAFLDGAPEEMPEPVAAGHDLGLRVASDRPTGRIALVGARVVTMRDAEKRQEIIDDGVVLIEGHRIAAVGKRGDVSIPEGTERIEVGGTTILPGLVDVHAHGAMSRNELTPEQNWMQFSNLSFGVTTIHDPSNDTSSIFAAAELQRAGKIVAPRIYSTGTILYGAHWPGFTAKIGSYEDAEFHVQRLKDVGAISVKSYQQPRRDQRQQVIAAGRKLGVMVVPEGGAKFQHNLNEIVDGHTGIEHALSVVNAYEDVKQLWSQSNTGYTPTFGVAYGGLSGETYWYDRTEVWENERLMRFAPRFVIEPASIRRTTAPDEHYNHFHVARLAKELRDRGVPVQIGAHGQREGLAAHWEMWMMHQGGFTPWEAFRGATIDGARYVGLDGDIGSIEAGKLADLIVVEGDPLREMRDSEKVRYTVLNGRLYEAETMNQIAPDKVARKPFFFEREGGNTVHPATQSWLEDLKLRHGWVH